MFSAACCMQMHMDLATQAYTRSVCDLGMDSGINWIFLSSNSHMIILFVLYLTYIKFAVIHRKGV